MQVALRVEGGFEGNHSTELIVMHGLKHFNIVLMDVNGKQVAVNLTPSQAVLLAEQAASFAKDSVA